MSRLSLFIFLTSLIIVVASCKKHSKQDDITQRTFLDKVSFVVNDSSFFQYIAEDIEIEIISSGHKWTEGPVWIESEQMLLFSDIPNDVIYMWKEGQNSQIYLTNAGGNLDNKIGSNGLHLYDNQLLLCQHGARQIAFMDANLEEPVSEFISIVSHFNGLKLNSPNDACISENGDIYFTDPPYGLRYQDEDSTKEIPYNGVYVYKNEGKNLMLLTDKLTRPNGITLSLDGNSLIVSNSDRNAAQWHLYELVNDSLHNQNIFYDATEASKAGEKGLPDGLKMHSSGTLFATGPGGVYLFSSELKLIGILKIDRATSNLAFDNKEENLFITADDLVLKIALNMPK